MIHVFLVKSLENTILQKSLYLCHSNDIHYAVFAKSMLLSTINYPMHHLHKLSVLGCFVPFTQRLPQQKGYANILQPNLQI